MEEDRYQVQSFLFICLYFVRATWLCGREFLILSISLSTFIHYFPEKFLLFCFKYFTLVRDRVLKEGHTLLIALNFREMLNITLGEISRMLTQI